MFSVGVILTSSAICADVLTSKQMWVNGLRQIEMRILRPFCSQSDSCSLGTEFRVIKLIHAFGRKISASALNHEVVPIEPCDWCGHRLKMRCHQEEFG
jgi:hypothetical protein